MISMSKDKKPKRVRPGHHVQVYIDQAVGDALERFLTLHRPKTFKGAAIEEALIKYLEDRGYWPLPPPE
jgi:hypothetical protein